MSDLTIRVLLVDDHAVVRQGLRAFLETQPDISVVGEASNGLEAVATAGELSPDVVLMDLVMHGGDGVSAIRALRQSLPRVRVLVLTSFVDEAHVFAAVEAGAAGYLLKDVEPEALSAAIRRVHNGQPVLHPDAATRLMRRGAEPVGPPLSRRELEVLRLLAEGFANKQIARRLGIAEKTVKAHVSSILTKMAVADRTQAAVQALRRGLLEDDPGPS
jgi:DNA-binding NarL/FixJ family response regulator